MHLYRLGGIAAVPGAVCRWKLVAVLGALYCEGCAERIRGDAWSGVPEKTRGGTRSGVPGETQLPLFCLQLHVG